MLSLNESLQKAGIPAYIRFRRMRYLQSRVISVLFTEKSRANQLVDNYSNILIKVAKVVDAEVIEVKVLKR